MKENNNGPLVEKEAPPIDSEYMNGKHIYSLSSPLYVRSGDKILVHMKNGKIVHIDTIKGKTGREWIKSLFIK